MLAANWVTPCLHWVGGKKQHARSPYMWLTASPFLPWPSKQQKSACRACPPNGKTTQPRSWLVFEIAPESMPRHEYMPTTCGVNGFATSTVSLTSAARTKTFAASSSSGSSIAFRHGAVTRTHPRREKRERPSETASQRANRGGASERRPRPSAAACASRAPPPRSTDDRVSRKPAGERDTTAHDAPIKTD